MILGASFDTVADNSAFAEKFSFPFLLLCDTDRQLAISYGAAENSEEVYPRRISYLIGPDGSVAKAYGRINPDRHPNQVLDDLAELMSQQ